MKLCERLTYLRRVYLIICVELLNMPVYMQVRLRLCSIQCDTGYAEEESSQRGNEK